MSTTHLRHSLLTSLQLLRKRPVFWLILGVAQFLLHWSQDVVPVAGSVIASIFSVWLMAAVYSPFWNRRVKALGALGFLFFPVTALWVILFSLQINTEWSDALSTAWAAPILFFMSLSLLTLNYAIFHIVEKQENLNRSLVNAWLDITRFFFSSCGLAVMIMAAGLIGLLTEGWAFVILSGWIVALLKATTPAISPADLKVSGLGSEASVDPRP